MGPPGAGKGSLAQLCIKELGWVQLSTGNLCRQHIAQKTQIGLEIDFFIKSGKLIPDPLIIEMVKDSLIKLGDSTQAFILDGFPRTVGQAQALDELLHKDSSFSSFDVVIVNLILDDAVALNRVSSRLVCKNMDCQKVYSAATNADALKSDMMCIECTSPLIRRVDDNHGTIKERLMIYHKHAHELINYYEKNGRNIERLMVERPLGEVFGSFCQLMGYKDI